MLRSSYTIYGKLFIGKYMLITAVASLIMLLQLPWGELYQLEWYREFIRIISQYSTNILKIPETNNKFPEYSMAFLAFVNMIGPIYALSGIIFGFRHAHKIKNIHININISLSKFTMYLIILVLSYIAMFWAVLMFSGESSTYPGRFYATKLEFVGFFTLAWFVVAMFGFIISTGFTSLFITLRNK